MVRGIYSTALTSMLVEKGFKIARPSRRISERLKIEPNKDPWDVFIESNPGCFGVRIYGLKDAFNQVMNTIGRTGYTVFCRSIAPVGGCYVGRVVRVEGRTAYVDTGDFIGVLSGSYEEGELVPVSTVKPTCKGHPQLIEGVAVAGRYAIVGENLQPRIPEGADRQTAAQLSRLATSMSRAGWGVQFLRTSFYTDLSELMREVNLLYAEADKLAEIEPREVGLLRDGLLMAKMNYSFNDKKVLDKARKKVVPTVLGHHYMRSLGQSTATLIALGERLVEKGEDWEQLGIEMIKSYISTNYNIGMMVKIRHYKPDGSYLDLTPGRVIGINEEKLEIRLHRAMKGSGGYYDGIMAVKEPGDYAISTYRLGEMVSETRYYSSLGELKGIYVNISTPVEFGWNYINYVDLMVDVVKTVDGEVRIIDIDQLENEVELGRIPQELAVRALRLAESIAKEIKKSS